jgi:hypothetical protein
VTLEEHVSFRALALGLPDREVLIRDSEEHVSVRALALGLPDGEILIRDSEEHVSFRALALGLPDREVLTRDSEEHVSVRALALGLRNKGVLVTLTITFVSPLGGACAGIPATALDPWVRACACSLSPLGGACVGGCAWLRTDAWGEDGSLFTLEQLRARPRTGIACIGFILGPRGPQSGSAPRGARPRL